MSAPKAIESFEMEKNSAFEGSSIFFDAPIERLKYHIMQTKGKIVKSEAADDGMLSVIWEAEGKRYMAWCYWPSVNYEVRWSPSK